MKDNQELNTKMIALIKTILEPVGKSKLIDKSKPITTLKLEMSTAQIIVDLKLCDKRNALTVGKIIKLDINIVPTTLIPNTIVIDVKNEIIWFNRFVFLPLTFA